MSRHDAPAERLGSISRYDRCEILRRQWDGHLDLHRERDMLWTIALILLILWALGFLAFNVGSGLIHLLLVIALVVIVYRLVTGRRPVA